MRRLSADWVLPVAGGPIENGAVLIDDRGRLVAVGSTHEVPSPEGVESERLEGAVLLPGLVNTHSHLELTGFAGQVNDDDFWQWIRHVIAIKAGRSEEDFFDAACAGIRQMWAGGVTTVCDTGSTGTVLAALDHLNASGVGHHEVFGARIEECQPAMKRFEADLARLARHATGRVSIGVSPHAPYTVSGDLYRASCDLARAHGVPIAVHMAEPPAESDLLRDFTGTFADLWREQAIPRPTDSPKTPVEFMDAHGVLSDRTLCIHSINVDREDMAIMARYDVAIAHCPRSNRHHHRLNAPAADYVGLGLRLGLGTDSEISVAPPDLIAECREASELTGWSSSEAIRALTLGGAEAIGKSSDAGSLEPGKWADLVAVSAPDTPDPEAAVVASSLDDVIATWLSGREVFRRDRR